MVKFLRSEDERLSRGFKTTGTEKRKQHFSQKKMQQQKATHTSCTRTLPVWPNGGGIGGGGQKAARC